MVKVNLRKAASYVSKENNGIDISVANASEAISDFVEYLVDNHKMSEIVAMLENAY